MENLLHRTAVLVEEMDGWVDIRCWRVALLETQTEAGV